MLVCGAIRKMVCRFLTVIRSTVQNCFNSLIEQLGILIFVGVMFQVF